MKNLFFVQRVLAAIIDWIVIYLPLYFLVNAVSSGYFTPEIVTAALFIIYHVVAVHSFCGKTIGKSFAKIKVKDTGISIMDDSVREVVKILYFLPILGWIVGLISIVLYFKTEKFLHDITAKSEVVLCD
ncbi:RDD family protein [Enterococcus sp. BWB1-3]|uniref:RDD family protein n=1 Tax=Enterococcus sp. BWB1-3 TaxID=2787713 RepID=UPI0019215826|nr:RDD family protein [Enterococcus sp. BWB1-3]MBL1229764.1 RDD family protein [Enterococcus sp. BWB1-3]